MKTGRQLQADGPLDKTARQEALTTMGSIAQPTVTAQGELLPVNGGEVRTPEDAASGLALVIERLAGNPSVDVGKLERIIELQERILRHQAEEAFNVAFVALQADIPTITERASTDKTTYAPLEDIIQPLRPILARHGFTLSHRSEWPDKATVKVIGILTHRQGHSRQSEFQAGADQTGSKNAIQALASSVSYGKRYTTKDLLCIVTRHEDDDGEDSDKSKQPEAPDGFDNWYSDLQAVADNGLTALEAMWSQKDGRSITYKNHLAKTQPKALASLKVKAAKVKAS